MLVYQLSFVFPEPMSKKVHAIMGGEDVLAPTPSRGTNNYKTMINFA